MISAKRTDKNQVVEILAAAFDENLIVNYISSQIIYLPNVSGL
jgi:hypothetical protein